MAADEVLKLTAPIAIIRPGSEFYDQIIEALRARQNELGLRYAFMDEWSGRAQGYWTHVLGPSRRKALSLSALSDLAAMFGFQVHFVLDMDAVRKMEAHWEKRQGNFRSKQYRFTAAQLSKDVVKRARPLVFKGFGQIGGNVRANVLSPKHVEAIARKGGRARARKMTKKQRRESARKAGLASAAAAAQRRASAVEALSTVATLLPAPQHAPCANPCPESNS